MGDELVRTALYDFHLSAGAKIVDFHGYELPIWYSSIQEEHLATQFRRSLRCLSYGSFRFQGEEVRSWLSSVSTQEYMKFQLEGALYHFLDHDGRIIDDMIFAVSSESEVLGVPNSTMVGIMFQWLSDQLPSDGSVTILDVSDETSIIALQGHYLERCLEVLGFENDVGVFRCQEIEQNELGISGWIKTGYTGEAGVEIFVSNEQAPILWDALYAHPSSTPVGLGARDTLRMEKGYLLSGQDFLGPGFLHFAKVFRTVSGTTSETSVPFGLDLSHDFIGKDALIESMRKGKTLGMQCVERGPSPRPGHQIFSGPDDDSELVGYVTSGGPSPSLGMTGIALEVS